jgi:hypothetical protein
VFFVSHNSFFIVVPVVPPFAEKLLLFLEREHTSRGSYSSVIKEHQFVEQGSAITPEISSSKVLPLHIYFIAVFIIDKKLSFCEKKMVVRLRILQAYLYLLV